MIHLGRPRCWYFDQDTGDPLPPHFGCPIYRCSFVHPDSPQWKSAPKTDRGRRSENVSMYQGDSSHRRPSDWSPHDRGAISPRGSSARRSRSRDETKPARSTESWRSGANATPLVSVRWGGDPIKPSGWGESSLGGCMESTSTSSGGNEAPNKPSSSDVDPSTKTPHEWNHLPPAWSKPSAPPPPSFPPPVQPRPPTSPRIRPRLPAAEESIPLTSSLTKPEEAARSLPESYQEQLSKSDVSSSQDKRKHYYNRLTLLTEAIKIRSEYAEVTRSLEARCKMRNTLRYTHVSENVQSKLNGFAQEYEDKSKDLKAKLENILTKIVDADVLANSISNEEALIRDQESFRNLQSRTDQLDNTVQTLASEINRLASQPREEHDGHLSTGQKRQLEPYSEGPPGDNNELLSRVEQLEAHISDIDNHNTQQMENVIQVVDTRLNLKMSKLRLGDIVSEDGELVDTTTNDPHSEAGASQSAGSLREQVTKLTRDHDEFVEETANLITKHAETTAEIQRLQDENLALKQAVSAYQSSFRKVQEVADRNERQVQALAEALRVMREQISQPSPMDIHALDQLRKQIMQEVVSSVDVSLRAFRIESEEMWHTSREETLKQIAAKLGPTMDLVSVIHGYFSRNWEKEGGPPST